MNSQRVFRNVIKIRNLCRFPSHEQRYSTFVNTVNRCRYPAISYNCNRLIRRKLAVNVMTQYYGSHTVQKSANEIERDFALVFKEICEDVCVEKCALTLISKRLEEILNYNVIGGKNVRGMAVVSSFKSLSRNLSDENIKLAYILGACAEMLHAFFLVLDDIMDNSTMRRGKICWFRRPEVGLEAVNDGLMIETCLYQVLKKHFSHKGCYINILDTFHEITKCTVWGQSLDIAACYDAKKSQFQKFTPEYYWSLIEHKTGMYTYCLPVHLAMHLDGTFTVQDYYVSRNVCLQLGRFFQMQDDYLDAYGNFQKTGKYGSDIKEGKCTWFAVSAIQMCSEAGRKVMEEYYGVDNVAAVEKIYELYSSLSLKQKYYEVESKQYSEIMSSINQLDDNSLKKDLFISFLKQLYRRER